MGPSTTGNARRFTLTASLCLCRPSTGTAGVRVVRPPTQGARASRPYKRPACCAHARCWEVALSLDAADGLVQPCVGLPDYFEERPQQWLMYIRLSPRFDASFRRASGWARILSREVAPQRRDAPDCFEERPQLWLLYIRLSPRFDAQVDGEQRTLDAKK